MDRIITLSPAGCSRVSDHGLVRDRDARQLPVSNPDIRRYVNASGAAARSAGRAVTAKPCIAHTVGGLHNGLPAIGSCRPLIWPCGVFYVSWSKSRYPFVSPGAAASVVRLRARAERVRPDL